MVLTLARGSGFHPYFMSTVHRGMREFIVPLPDTTKLPKEIELYLKCSWKGDNMPLLDWLRKTTNEGHIIGWLRKLHKQATDKQDSVILLSVTQLPYPC